MACVFAVTANAQEGQPIYWANSVSGINNGDWFGAGNWTFTPPPDNFTNEAAPPTNTEQAIVGNDPVAQIGAPPNGGPGAVANELLITTNTPFGENAPVAGQVVVSGAGATLTLFGNTITPPPTVGIAFRPLAAGDPLALDIETGSLTVENGGTVTAPTTLIAAAGQLNIGGGGTSGTFNGTAITDNGAINFNFTDSTTLSAAISGTGVLTKLGAGTLTLTGNNTYSGGTTISGGTVIARSADSLGSGLVVINNGATLDNFGSIAAPISSTAGGANLINESGATITGNIALGNSASSVHLFSGSTINGNLNLGSSAGSTLILDGTGTSTLSQAVTGTITDAGSLTKQGSGTWTIDKALSAPAAVNINAGILQVDSQLSTAQAFINNGSTLNNFGTITGSVGSVTGVANLINEEGSAISGNVVLGNSANNVHLFAGSTISGNLNLGSNAGSTLILDGSGNAAISQAVGGTITNVGSLTKQGSGTWTVDKSFSAPVAVNINGGILQVRSQLSTAQAFINNGSTLDNFGSITGSIGSATGGANLVNEVGSLISGNVVLGNSANNVHLFAGSTISGNLNLGSNAGSTLILDGSGNAAISQAVGGTIINAGSLTKQGSGTWTVDKVLNAPVAVNVAAGTLEVDSHLTTAEVNVLSGATLKGVGQIGGIVINAGIVSPGDSPGTLTINGNYTQTSSGTFNVLILSPTNFTQLVVTGHASLSGTLRLTLGSGYVPARGTQFAILTAAGGISGTFQKFVTPSGQTFNLTYTNGQVAIVAGSQKVVPPIFHLSDGTPTSSTAVLADSMFYDFGSLATDMAQSGKENSVGVSFDAGAFTFEGRHGDQYGFPITGQFKLTDRMKLFYQVPLYYLEFEDTGLFQSGLTLELPTKLIIATPDQHFSWDITPGAGVVASGSREIIGAGAVTNVLAYRFPAFTLTYGNYFGAFAGNVTSSDDQQFPVDVDQRILKNGLKLTAPFGNGWVLECYGIYTQFLRTAPVSSYVTAGFELGRHFFWNVEGQNLDLGYLSLGLYTEQGNRYSSGHVRLGSAWRF